jgi:lipopolysaccharide/colanic/teichoic acid biosynthesis glycosyltransferase
MGLVDRSCLKDYSESVLKNLFDFIVSLFGFFLFFPVFLGIMLAIYLEDGLPFFYTQERVGRNGRIFKLLKFRSMVKNAEAISGPVLSSEQDKRITKVGAMLRATAMDELPQLINILKGDMSFVGPRSERPCFVEKFNKEIPHYAMRHQVRPGLTGFAQIYGRYNTTARNKLRFDFITLKHASVWDEIRLIMISFSITFRGKWTVMQGER